jgi:hypothetical protein
MNTLYSLALAGLVKEALQPQSGVYVSTPTQKPAENSDKSQSFLEKDKPKFTPHAIPQTPFKEAVKRVGNFILPPPYDKNNQIAAAAKG